MIFVASSLYVLQRPIKYHIFTFSTHIQTPPLTSILFHQLQDFLSHERRERCDDKKIIMAWNNGDLPLHNGVLPPFLYGKGFHTLWVVNEALSSDFRFVFDASWTISSFFISSPDDGDTMEARNWENVGNSHLKAFYGSLSTREASYSNVIKLFKCNGHYHFGSTTENMIYPLGSHIGLSFTSLRIFRSGKHKKLLSCFDNIRSLEGNVNCSNDKQLTSLEPLSLPFSLEVLLSTRSDQNKTIVLAVAGYSYKDMLMSWVCRLHLLHVSNFVVCALDDEIYDFCVLQVSNFMIVDLKFGSYTSFIFKVIYNVTRVLFVGITCF